MTDSCPLPRQEKCQHDYVEGYYGTKCSKCGVFYAYGCAPWDDKVDSWRMDDADYLEDDCCYECGGEGWVEGDCGEDTCCCADPVASHGIVRCPLCGEHSYGPSGVKPCKSKKEANQ